MPKALRIGSRRSILALIQAEEARQILAPYYPIVELVQFVTSGDKITTPLYDVGGKGLFIKELEQALLDNKIDVAVHSLKDVPAYYSPELIIKGFLKRVDPRDAFLSTKLSSINQIKSSSIIGTSSFRRKVQLKNSPIIHMLRGNINSRVKKIPQFDGIILAVAGLKRAKLENYITELIPFSSMIPAVGQGVICLQCRKKDDDLVQNLEALSDPITSICVKAERSFQETINGDCTTPLGGIAEYYNCVLTLNCMLATSKGVYYTRRTGGAQDAQNMGRDAAQELIINSCYKA